jgi:hypothetical protein
LTGDRGLWYNKSGGEMMIGIFVGTRSTEEKFLKELKKVLEESGLQARYEPLIIHLAIADGLSYDDARRLFEDYGYGEDFEEYITDFRKEWYRSNIDSINDFVEYFFNETLPYLKERDNDAGED